MDSGSRSSEFTAVITIVVVVAAVTMVVTHQCPFVSVSGLP